MESFHLKDNLLNSLAKKYETPLFVYNGDLIKQRYTDLFKFIKWPKLKIFYAMKANYNIEILKLLKNEGAGLDTVSPGDIILALKIGFSPSSMIYTANNITDEEMRLVKSKGVLFNIGELSRLEKYAKEFPNTDVCIRFNPEVVAGDSDKTKTAGALSKFGILMEDVPRVVEIAKKHNLRIIGLHSHTGSGIADKEKYIQAMKNIMGIASAKDFPDLQFMDFGGGFKVPYEPDEHRIDYVKFGQEITQLFSEHCKKYGRELGLYFEPGKYMVAESAYLLVEVNTIRNNRGRIIVGTNSGFPQLIRPTYYGAYHHIVNVSNPKGAQQKYDIYGNICEGGDVFAKERELPKIREGDVLAIQNAGAYCYAMGGVYNLRPMPAEVMIASGKDYLVRRRLSFEELAAQIIGESK